MRSLKSREESGILVVTLDDPASLNEGRSDTFRETLYEVVSNQTDPRVALNLRAIEYLSSSGVALLIGLKRRLDGRGGRLVLCELQPYIHDILSVMKLQDFFMIVTDEPSALAALQSSPSS